MLKAATEITSDARHDRRLRAAYRRELVQSVRGGALLYAGAIVAVAAFALVTHPTSSRPLVVVDIAAVAIALVVAYAARRRGRHYVVQLGMLLGLLPMVTSFTQGMASADQVAESISGTAMIPVAFAILIPLDRIPHRVWLVLANLWILVALAGLGADTGMAKSASPLVITMLSSTAISLIANEVLARRRDQSNRQVLAVRDLYRKMQERETDLRRQDEFLMMQQETLVVQQAELLRLNEELEHIARIDALTNLGNRLRLNEDLAQLSGRIERSGGTHGLLLLDLDRFKRLNDTMGHLAGDAALKGVADVLRRTARVGDGLYRYGGEEFLIVLHDCDEGSLELAGQRYIAAVAAAGMAHPDNHPWGVVTASAGAAELSQHNGVDVDAALRAADEALYQAKAHGRNRLEVHRCHEADAQVVSLEERKRAAS